jgi:hypothetical protein
MAAIPAERREKPKKPRRYIEKVIQKKFSASPKK